MEVSVHAFESDHKSLSELTSLRDRLDDTTKGLMKQSESVRDVGVDSAHGWDADENRWISRCEATMASYRRQRS
jgi:hypothetical protein